MNSFVYRYSKIWHQFFSQAPLFHPLLTSEMGFPTLVTPMHCSETLREWIGKLTEDDCEKLRLWGILSKLLRATMWR